MVRNHIRDLAKQFNLAVWMTEVSHGDLGALSYDNFRARAIHIHDELVYADAAAYFALSNMWDTRSQFEHFGNRNIFEEESSIALIDSDNEKVYITAMGRAIGQYARLIRKGSVRIQGDTSDPLVQVTAFRDDARGRAVLVLINNADRDTSVSVSLDGMTVSGSIAGEQSVPDHYWQPVSSFDTSDAASFSTTVPPLSVTTLVWPIS
jgi:O-glycosyl hydrolase